jgi:O-antigen ligase
MGLWLLNMLLHREARLLRSRPITPLLAFVGVTIVAFAAGTQPWLIFAETAPLAAQAGGLAMIVLSAGAFLLVAHQIRDERWLQWLTWAFLILGGLYVAGALTRDGGRFTGRLFQRGADGSLFWTWLVALAFSQAIFNRHLNLVWRLFLAGIIVAVFYIRLIQAPGWTSGWLPPMLTIIVTLLVGAPRLGLLAALAGSAAVMSSPDESLTLLMSGDNEYSKTTRLEAWSILAEILKSSNPILGLGPANYYWYTPLMPIEGYYVKFNSHNNYVDIAAQTGLLGLACFLWFAAAIGWLGWRLRSRVPPGFSRAYVFGALGGLAGTLIAAMLGDWVLPFVYNVGFDGFRASVLGWLFLGGLVSLERIADREDRVPGSPSARRPVATSPPEPGSSVAPTPVPGTPSHVLADSSVDRS